MNYKLTLNIDKELSEQAKIYARSQGRSLSDLVSNYFKAITSSQQETGGLVSPGIKAMKGILKAEGEYDYKKELAKELSKKYLK